MRSAVYVLLLGAACGRLDFAPGAGGQPHDAPATSDAPALARDTPAASDAPAPATDAPRFDAPPDAAALTIAIDPGPHHLGDTPGGTPNTPEGTVVTDHFTVPVTCGSGTVLELDFVGPFGPNMADEPTLTLDGSDLGHVFPFFPPFTDPAWAAGGGEYNGPNDDHMFDIHVALPCTPALGSNTFVFTTHDTADDMFIESTLLSCANPGS